MRAKILLTTVIAVVLAAIAVGFAVTRPQTDVEVDPDLTLRTPGVLVRDTGNGHLAVVRPDGSRTFAAVECSRAYAAGGRALCLQSEPTAPGTFRAVVLDETLATTRTLSIPGVPTRTRVSANGRLVAWTVFVSGDSYTTSGFSTRSGLLDLETGTTVASLETFTVDGQKPPVDANFWGVSFADDDTFYATMSTGTHFFLVRGSVASRRLEIIADGVECPSLSPDGTRVVYKRRLPDLTWQLWVLDLATQARIQLAEPGNVDDQGAWLDDRTIAYGKVDEASGRSDVWSVPADGSGTPTRIAEGAESPSVMR